MAWRRMRRGLVLLVLVSFAACRRDVPPPQVTVEEVVAELAPPPPDGPAVEAAPAAVRAATLQPEVDRPGVVTREALVAAPPATVTMRIAVPPDALLRFNIGVDGAKRYERGQSGIEFGVRVDGHERFHETLNPAERT